MKNLPIYREIPAPQIPDRVADVIAYRLGLVLDEMDRNDKSRADEETRGDMMEGDKFDGLE